MADVPRPLPNLAELDTRPFWEATKRHELRYQVCNACSGVVFYTRRHCPHCMSFDLRWERSKGEGTVYSYTIIRQIGHPVFRARAPYAVALIDLETPGAATEYRLGLRNFYVLTRYNRSAFYAAAVHDLARELRGRR